MQRKISLLITIITLTTASELPSHFKICSKSDPNFKQCFEEATRIAVLSMFNGGLPELGVPSLNPLHVDKIEIGADNQEPVSIKQIYSNITFYTTNLDINAEIVDLDKLLFVLTSKSNEIDFVGNYKIEGKILLLPIYGQGRSNISMSNVTIRHEMHLEKFEKNGETYLKIMKYLVKTMPLNIKFQLDNLFNGDRVLETQILKLLNENALMIFEEYEKYFSQAFGMIYTQLGNKIFTRVPYDKIFP